MTDDVLIEAARKAQVKAYAPYSKFKVGAALSTPDGRVFSGANVENASYSLSMCAERMALLKAVSEGQRVFEILAVAVGTDDPAPPCGACLQSLSEFNPDLRIIMVGRKARREAKLKDLLPSPFSLLPPPVSP